MFFFAEWQIYIYNRHNTWQIVIMVFKLKWIFVRHIFSLNPLIVKYVLISSKYTFAIKLCNQTIAIFQLMYMCINQCNIRSTIINDVLNKSPNIWLCTLHGTNLFNLSKVKVIRANIAQPLMIGHRLWIYATHK